MTEAPPDATSARTSPVSSAPTPTQPESWVRATMPSVSGARVEVSQERFVPADQALDEPASRLARTRLPTSQGVGWEQGVPTDWLHVVPPDGRERSESRLGVRVSDRRECNPPTAGPPDDESSHKRRRSQPRASHLLEAAKVLTDNRARRSRKGAPGRGEAVVS
jgi:hypothetical protein